MSPKRATRPFPGCRFFQAAALLLLLLLPLLWLLWLLSVLCGLLAKSRDCIHTYIHYIYIYIYIYMCRYVYTCTYILHNICIWTRRILPPCLPCERVHQRGIAVPVRSSAHRRALPPRQPATGSPGKAGEAPTYLPSYQCREGRVESMVPEEDWNIATDRTWKFQRGKL